jgi:hypothetical protein
MMRGILKPMPTYQSHNLVGVFIPASGREFVVDDKAASAFAPTTLLEQIDKSDVDDDRKALARREVIGTHRGGFCDEPGKPLLLTSKAFAFVKERIGTALLVEPVGGDGLVAAEALTEKERELDRARFEIAEAAKAMAELDASKQELAAAAAAREQEFAALKARISELEAAGKKK